MLNINVPIPLYNKEAPWSGTIEQMKNMINNIKSNYGSIIKNVSTLTKVSEDIKDLSGHISGERLSLSASEIQKSVYEIKTSPVSENSKFADNVYVDSSGNLVSFGTGFAKLVRV